MVSGQDIHGRIELQFRIEQFYYAEAAALDERRFEDWLSLFTDDARYWMPVRRTRMAKELDKEFSMPGGVAYFDDDKKMLTNRVKKLLSGYSWSEDPPSRTRHLIANIRIDQDREETLAVSSSFHIYRGRFDDEEDNFFGKRVDVLRRAEDSFLIESREIYLDQTVILARNMSLFF